MKTSLTSGKAGWCWPFSFTITQELKRWDSDCYSVFLLTIITIQLNWIVNKGLVNWVEFLLNLLANESPLGALFQAGAQKHKVVKETLVYSVLNIWKRLPKKMKRFENIFSFSALRENLMGIRWLWELEATMFLEN